MDIRIEYDGKYPCLCMGHLKVYINDTIYDFGKFCLTSGGSIHRNDDWDMWATQGKWAIEEFPPNFPNEFKDDVINKVNEEIPHGCCGGCI